MRHLKITIKRTDLNSVSHDYKSSFNTISTWTQKDAKFPFRWAHLGAPMKTQWTFIAVGLYINAKCNVYQICCHMSVLIYIYIYTDLYWYIIYTYIYMYVYITIYLYISIYINIYNALRNNLFCKKIVCK